MNVLITPAQSEPVTITEAIDHLRESDDSLVSLYLRSATESIEEELIGRVLMQQTFEYHLEDWCLDDDYITLPKAPLVSIVSIKYDDLNEVEQTLPTTQYQLDTVSKPGRVRFVGVTLPEVFDKPFPIRIRYVAGYGSPTSDADQQRLLVPFPLKAAILMRLGQLWENRQEEITGSITAKFSVSVERMIAPYRLPVC